MAFGGRLSERDQSKLIDAANDIGAANTNIANLKASSSEIDLMASTKDMKFTFKEISGLSGETGPAENGLITMKVVSDANKIHELSHDFNFWKGIQGSSVWGTEIKPYQRQFSFDASTVTGHNSLAGQVTSYGGINQAWVAGIQSDGKFTYSPAWNKDDAGLQKIVYQFKS